MKAQDLKAGDLFKLPGQRFFRQVGKRDAIDLAEIYEPDRDKVLIVLDDCGQYILAKEQEVLTPAKTAN